MKPFLSCLILCFALTGQAFGQEYTITHYCACVICCGSQAQGLTASGKQVKSGMVACNHLPFGTKVKIAGKVYTVEDRGSKRYFGTFKDIHRHIDIYIPDHVQALKLGILKRYVEVLK